jgi:hypothetical protein
MKNLKRLQAVEERLNEVCLARARTQEYIKWLQEHPIRDSRDSPFDFYEWLDSMPPHLTPCFQAELRRLFYHLDHC